MCDRMLWWYCCHTLDEISPLTNNSLTPDSPVLACPTFFCACLCSVFLQHLGIPGPELKKPVASSKEKQCSPQTQFCLKHGICRSATCSTYKKKKKKSGVYWTEVMIERCGFRAVNACSKRNCLHCSKEKWVAWWPTSNDFHFGLHLFIKLLRLFSLGWEGEVPIMFPPQNDESVPSN